MYVFPCVILFLCFSVLLVLRLPRLGEREIILVLFVRLFDLCLFGFVGSSSSWGLGRAAVCDCGTPWTFLLPFFPTDCSKAVPLLHFLVCASPVSYVEFVLLLFVPHNPVVFLLVLREACAS